MELWSLREASLTDFGDVRLTRRYGKLLEDLAARSESSVPQACGNWAATKAAYRFWDDEQVTAQAIREGQSARTVERMKQSQQGMILAIQDTTELVYRSPGSRTGLGPLPGAKTAGQAPHGLLVHSVLAVSAEGVPLGLLHQQVWARPEPPEGKAKLSKGQRRKEKESSPIEEKESYRWLSSVQAVQALSPKAQEVLIVADQEADIFALWALPRRRGLNLLVRAYEDRRVQAPEKRLWAAAAQAPVVGTQTVEVQEGNGHTARRAQVEVRLSQQEILAPAHRAHSACSTALVRMSVILVQECHPPQGEEPLCWRLLTTLRIDTFAQACQCIAWYCLRWVIERYHFVLKSGCRIERLQLETAERLERALATYGVVAWRLLWLTYQAREHAQESCETAFQPSEWQALQASVTHNPLVGDQPPTLQQAVRWVAQLGGFLARKSDGDPGVQTIWRGLRRLEDLSSMWLLLHASPPVPG